MPEVIDKRALKEASLKALAKRQEGRVVVWDALMPNMAVRVGRRGRPTYYVARRMPGAPNPTWRKLGTWPTMTLAEAREKAREAIKALEAGHDPKEIAAQERREAERDKATAERSLFRNVAKRFIQDYCPTIRSAGTYERRIRNKMIPVLGDMPLPEIRRGDVVVLLQKIAKDNGKGAAIGARSVLSQLFSWALTLDIPGFDVNPAAAVKPRTLFGKKPEPRGRLLTMAEVAAVWRAAATIAEPFSTLYRVLLLTGCRRQEIARAQWADFDDKAATLLIPASRTKNAKDYLIPLSPTAARLIAEVPRWSGPYILTTRCGRAAVGNFGQAKERLDRAIADMGVEIEPWVLHDFRRVVRSALSRLGVAEEIAELCLGHVQGGIVGTYNRYTYLNERREALERWERDLLATVAPAPEPPAENVVAMSDRRRA